MPRPAVFEINKHGHSIFTIRGYNLTGEQELRRLEATLNFVGDHACQMFTGRGKGSYDDAHRLVEGWYRIVLVPGWYIPRDNDRTVNTIRAKVIKKFNYGEPLAGIAPCLFGPTFEEQMESIGSPDIVIPHQPISAADKNPYVLARKTNNNIPCLSSCYGHPLSEDDLFAFFSNPDE
ncbi:MAG: hypothetical protein WC887_02065 [Candidatus Paceibacterota bacterium]|jgi:hypothetical protein